MLFFLSENLLEDNFLIAKYIKRIRILTFFNYLEHKILLLVYTGYSVILLL